MQVKFYGSISHHADLSAKPKASRLAVIASARMQLIQMLYAFLVKH